MNHLKRPLDSDSDFDLEIARPPQKKSRLLHHAPVSQKSLISVPRNDLEISGSERYGKKAKISLDSRHVAFAVSSPEYRNGAHIEVPDVSALAILKKSQKMETLVKSMGNDRPQNSSLAPIAVLPAMKHEPDLEPTTFDDTKNKSSRYVPIIIQPRLINNENCSTQNVHSDLWNRLQEPANSSSCILRTSVAAVLRGLHNAPPTEAAIFIPDKNYLGRKFRCINAGRTKAT